jgi:hypothetical protein
MRYVALLIVALLLPMVAEGQVTSLRQVAGPDIQQEGSADGAYIRAVPSGERDTLWVWVQHVTRGHPPDRASAAAADLVVWCHPDMYPSKKHILPGHDGRIAIVQQGDRLWIVPEGTVFWDRHVHWSPPRR